ncbi:hypothetical protein AVEN_207457-1 [Araneus ventricosus]|uniref:Uncharacterized protein n=1 Tax=Araneus ventricosus TaxID=182803 RepID=A0A4Y2ECW6_ARAVE|nr:hypothetical protein AVEN_207457-1 [Araneus ventricosus]
MACLDRIRNFYGRCPVWNCKKYPAKDGEYSSEMDISSGTDMDTTSQVDEQEQITAWIRNENMHGSDFQLVSPRKAARPTTMEMETTRRKRRINFLNLLREMLQSHHPEEFPKLT